jgi:mono/diheme cytochrome c family protein
MKIRFGIFAIVTAAAMTASYATATLRAQDPAAASAQDPAAASAQDPAAASAKSSTWDNVYSKEQATKGETLYNDQCARCHGTNASGADAPALAGAEFAANWDALTVDQLFDRIRNTMPQDNPQTLSREDTAALVAYVLDKNGFPAGDAALPAAGGALAKITYTATKK